MADTQPLTLGDVGGGGGRPDYPGATPEEESWWAGTHGGIIVLVAIALAAAVTAAVLGGVYGQHNTDKNNDILRSITNATHVLCAKIDELTGDVFDLDTKLDLIIAMMTTNHQEVINNQGDILDDTTTIQVQLDTIMNMLNGSDGVQVVANCSTCTDCPVVQKFFAATRQEDSFPADCAHGVGPDRIVEAHNNHLTLRDKKTLQLLDRVVAETFIDDPAGTFLAATDPVVHYDELAERFWYTDFSRFSQTAALEVTAPGSATGLYPASSSIQFPPPFSVSGNLVPADPLNADTPLVNAAEINGSIALVADDGFQTGSTNKVGNACAAGAIGVIIYQSDPNVPIGGIFGNPCAPSISLAGSIGNDLVAAGGNATGTIMGTDLVVISQIRVAVSRTSSPNSFDPSEWYRYLFGAPNANGTFYAVIPDYEKTGFDATAYYISDNRFGETTFVAETWVLDKASLVDGTAPQRPAHIEAADTLARFVFPRSGGEEAWNLPVPAAQFAPQWSGIESNFLVGRAGLDNQTQDTMQVMLVDSSVNTPTLRTFDIAVDPWDNVLDPASPVPFPAVARQANVNAFFGTLTSFFIMPGTVMYSAQLRGTSLLAAISATNEGRVEIRWYEFDVSAVHDAADPRVTLKQQGRIWDPVNSYYYPHINMDVDGNIAIGYVSSGPNKFVHVGYTVHLCDDPLGTVRYPLQDVFVSNGSYLGTNPDFTYFPVVITRFNDYPSLTVDPSDGKTFRFYSETPNINQTALEQEFILEPWVGSWFAFRAEEICGTEPLLWDQVPPEPVVAAAAPSAAEQWAGVSAEEIDEIREWVCARVDCRPVEIGRGPYGVGNGDGDGDGDAELH